MRLVLALAPASLLLACLLCAPVLAHGSYNTSDYDHDGDSVISYYRAADFEKGFGQGIRSLNRLAKMPGSHAPIWRRTLDKNKAEVLIQYAPLDNFFRTTYYCGNSAYIHNPGIDTMNLDPQCADFYTPVRHEGGHMLGMFHHPVGTLPRTIMYPSGWHPSYWPHHDKRYARQIEEGR